MVKALRVLGSILVAIGILAIIIGHGLVWWNEGFWAMTEMLSPRNFANMLAVLAMLAPGFGVLWLADRLAKRKQ